MKHESFYLFLELSIGKKVEQALNRFLDKRTASKEDMAKKQF